MILGAAGRDFHNFNVLYRGRPKVRVVAFTAAQIPNITGRAYPPSLAGPGYPDGIPIVPEAELPRLIERERVDRVELAYSDLAHAEVMHKASVALAAGAGFSLAAPRATMLPSRRPVVSVCAVRTGSGKSPLTRYIARWLRARGLRVAVVRHPMPYGDLAAQAVQRLATMEDLDRAQCTIEEREEYEPHLRDGGVVFAGVDYGAILRRAETEADLILWDGGNNDLPFYRSDLEIVVADPHRPGHEVGYFPGEVNFRRAAAIVVSKTDSARSEDILTVEQNAGRLNPAARILRGGLTLSADRPERLKGRSVLVVEDGPTVTHGGLAFGAGTLVARENGALPIDPRRAAVGSIARVFQEYPHLERVLPAMGYGPEQVRELEATIRRSGAELVVDGSPVDLQRIVKIDVPVVNVTYAYDDLDGGVAKLLQEFLAGNALGRTAPPP